MKTNSEISIAGQWFGFYNYGPEYGPALAGERVIFSLLIEQASENEFRGKCIEIEGIGSSTKVSTIEGSLDNNFISFIKTYPEENVPGEENMPECENRLSYRGKFEPDTGRFRGSWEMWSTQIILGNQNNAEINTGDWEISQSSERYGL